MQTVKHNTFARPNRRELCFGAATLAAANFATSAMAQDTTGDNADFLFVQTAKGMAYAAHENRLTLRDVSPVTLFFSDRPDRVAGNMTTERFVPFWSEGTDSFLSDPPNADLSILEGDELLQVVAVLEDPKLVGNDLHYTVRQVLEGTMPVLGNNVSVFISTSSVCRSLRSLPPA